MGNGETGVKKVDLKTVRKLITTAGTSLAGPVPAGMQRWVTFVRIVNQHVGIQKLWICSTPAAMTATTPAAASAAAKMSFYLQALERENVPERGPTDHKYPLFSIAADKYLTAQPALGNASVFVQYYDE